MMVAHFSKEQFFLDEQQKLKPDLSPKTEYVGKLLSIMLINKTKTPFFLIRASTFQKPLKIVVSVPALLKFQQSNMKI
jgi:hypothetical protein